MEEYQFGKLATAIDNLARIVEKSGKAAPFDYEIWDVDDIAGYLRYEKSTVRNLISKPFFTPKPIKIGGNGQIRYKAKDVVDWAFSFKR